MFRGGGPGGGREGPEEEDMMVPAALSLAFWALVSCPLGGGGGGPGGGGKLLAVVVGGRLLWGWGAEDDLLRLSSWRLVGTTGVLKWSLRAMPTHLEESSGR
jgi:hypothetical protein